MNILGISAMYHDSAAALVRDGEVVAAAQQERFSRIKHDRSIPAQAMAFCLRRGGVEPGDLDAIAFYDKPVASFSRFLATALHMAPHGFGQFRAGMPSWLREKLWVPYLLERELARLGHPAAEVLFMEHHESHAASAFLPSPFRSAAILTFDGVGEWATTSIGIGRDDRLDLLRQIHFPHSIGMLYSAFTEFCGFVPDSDEYKLMGLAPYGEPSYTGRILDDLVDLRPDGSFTLDVDAFEFVAGTRMAGDRFDELFDGPRREPGATITRRDVDVARSAQAVVETIVLHVARHAAEVTGERNACLAGGVALNCVSNARLRVEGPFEKVWVQPAAGDAGGALGAAMLAHLRTEPLVRSPGPGDAMAGTLLGPRFSPGEIEDFLRRCRARHRPVPDDAERAALVARRLAAGEVVALFNGRMEFGPRALGGRSILADPRTAAMRDRLNAMTKRREAFRPFAPAVLAEHAHEWFDLDAEDPYMTFVGTVRDAVVRPPSPAGQDVTEGWTVEGPLPAVTHVDRTARVQTVSADRSPELHRILTAFGRLTGCPVLVNTSFNVRGEPIVCTPADAYRCFASTDIDLLVMERSLVERPEDHAPTASTSDPVERPDATEASVMERSALAKG